MDVVDHLRTSPDYSGVLLLWNIIVILVVARGESLSRGWKSSEPRLEVPDPEAGSPVLTVCTLFGRSITLTAVKCRWPSQC